MVCAWKGNKSMHKLLFGERGIFSEIFILNQLSEKKMRRYKD